MMVSRNTSCGQNPCPVRALSLFFCFLEVFFFLHVHRGNAAKIVNQSHTSSSVSMRLRNTLYPNNEQMNDDQRRYDHGQDEHVNEVHARHRERREFGAREQQGGDVFSDQRARVGEVDADDGSTVSETVPREEIARIAKHDGQGHEGHTDEPVEFTRVAIGAGEVNTAHVKEDTGHHEVRRPVVNGSQDIAKR